MEVSAASLSALSQDRIASEVGVRVAKKALDAQKAEGDAAVQLLEAAAKVAKSGAEGLDTYA